MSRPTETTTYRNPIVPGFSPDPSVVFVDGIFYLVASSFHVFPGIPIYASRDLKEWKQSGNAINRREQLSLADAIMIKVPLDTGHFMVGAGGLFAPTIRHHNGTFYIICTNCLGFEESGDMQNFYITTDDIWSDKWSDPIYVPFHGIDPSLFFDDDGKVYFQGCFSIDRMKQPSCTIKQFEIDVETGTQLTDAVEIWGGHAKYDTEAPHIYKIGKWYYLMVAEGGTFEHHMLTIGRSESIWGPYDDYENNPILTSDGTNEYIQNMGHGELFQDGKGRWWAVGLGVRNENEGDPFDDGTFVAPLGRESFLTAMEWPEGGWPKISQPKMEFEAPRVKSHKADELPSPPHVNDLYIRTPDLSKYRLYENNSQQILLTLSQADFCTLRGTSTFLGRRQRSLASVATASLTISGLPKGVRAGLALYKDSLRHVSIIYDSGSRSISLRAVSLEMDKTFDTQIAVESSTEAVNFKIIAGPKEWAFFANLGDNGGGWKALGRVEAWKLAAREMTGPLLGVFAHAQNEGSEKHWVKFNDLDVKEG